MRPYRSGPAGGRGALKRRSGDQRADDVFEDLTRRIVLRDDLDIVRGDRRLCLVVELLDPPGLASVQHATQCMVIAQCIVTAIGAPGRSEKQFGPAARS
jgi:hypothetical protein